ncbi:MAG: flagellar FlbD family protein [Candidatus Aminicenantes bacterium]|nr:flagellar FlbD family protein [Candidatus Aminicenantes bacterium]
MIRVIRNDGMEVLLNIDFIQTVQKGPETVVTLHTGDKIVLKSPYGDVMQKIDACRLGIREEDKEDRRKSD